MHPDEIIELGHFIATELKRLDEDYILKDKALEYVIENHYDEIKEAVFEQEADNKNE